MNSSRRRFLQSASLLGAASSLGSLGSLSIPFFSSPAFAQVTDYRALICIFLYGANDNGNTVIPLTGYGDYLNARGGTYHQGGVAIPDTRLTGTTLNGGKYALNPGMPRLAGLYNARHAAIVGNVGTLIEPTTYDAAHDVLLKTGTSRSAELPPKLRSHNDQQAFWQSLGVEGTGTGWGGRFADRYYGAENSGDDAIFSSVSVYGQAVFNAGASTPAYQVSPEGALAFEAVTGTDGLFGLGKASSDATITALLTNQGANQRRFERDLNTLRARSLVAEGRLADVLPALLGPATRFGGDLGAQLAMVWRMMKAGKAMGLKRQVFHVGITGFDMHDGLVVYNGDVPAASTHESLLKEVDTAIGDLWDQLTWTDMPTDQKRTPTDPLPREVTMFTASDFGRTITPNNDGSDHAWGSHHFVVGGGVLGGKIEGRIPDFKSSDPSWMPRGTLCPEIATQQLAYTLGTWFGLTDAELKQKLGTIDRFPAPLLDLLRPL